MKRIFIEKPNPNDDAAGSHKDGTTARPQVSFSSDAIPHFRESLDKAAIELNEDKRMGFLKETGFVD